MILVDIAREIGCDPITVRRWVKSSDIKIYVEKASNGKLVDAISIKDAENFKSWWKSRGVVPKGFVVLNDLAAKCGVDRNTVKSWGEKNDAKFSKYFGGKGKASWLIDKNSAKVFQKIYYDADKAVAVDDLLNKYKCNWRAANRWSKRTGIKFVKVKGKSRSRKGILPEQATQFEQYLKSIKEGGYLYLIQLLPDCWPGRVKFGFAYLPERRIAEHRITCPNACLLGQWECLRHKEKSIIKTITKNIDCLSLTSEVFDFKDVNTALQITQDYFTKKNNLAQNEHK